MKGQYKASRSRRAAKLSAIALPAQEVCHCTISKPCTSATMLDVHGVLLMCGRGPDILANVIDMYAQMQERDRRFPGEVVAMKAGAQDRPPVVEGAVW